MDGLYKKKKTKNKNEYMKTLIHCQIGKGCEVINLKRLKALSRSFSVNATSVCKDPDVGKPLSSVHGKYVVVPPDKAQRSIVFVCRTTLHSWICKMYKLFSKLVTSILTSVKEGSPVLPHFLLPKWY